MRMRSTGLGKTELEADVAGLEAREGLIILHLRTTRPVLWHVRAAVQRQDIFKLIGAALNFGIVKQVMRMVFGRIFCTKPAEPSEF